MPAFAFLHLRRGYERQPRVYQGYTLIGWEQCQATKPNTGSWCLRDLAGQGSLRQGPPVRNDREQSISLENDVGISAIEGREFQGMLIKVACRRYVGPAT